MVILLLWESISDKAIICDLSDFIMVDRKMVDRLCWFA